MNLGSSVVCHRCGRPGHIAPNCPQRSQFRGGAQAGRHTGGRGNGRRGGGGQCFAAMQADPQGDAMEIDSEHQLESRRVGPNSGN